MPFEERLGSPEFRQYLVLAHRRSMRPPAVRLIRRRAAPIKLLEAGTRPAYKAPRFASRATNPSRALKGGSKGFR